MTAKKREYKKRNVITVRMHRDMYNIISKVFVLSVILATISFGLLGLACYRMYYTQLALEQIDARYSTTKTSELLSLTQEIVVKQQQDSNLLKAVASNNEQENKQLKEENKTLTAKVNELSSSNNTLMLSAVEMARDLEVYKAREELYDKYSYAIIDPDRGTRTDITYEQLERIEDILEEHDINPKMATSIIMTESRGVADATSETGAKGLAQVTSSTGKMVWTNVMGKSGTPDLYDPDTNINIMCNYLVYLKDRKGSVYDVLDSYRGVHSQGYINTVNKWCKYGGTDLDEINKECYKQ